MSKLTNDGLTRSGTRCVTTIPMWLQWASKGKQTLDSVCYRQADITDVKMDAQVSPTVSVWFGILRRLCVIGTHRLLLSFSPLLPPLCCRDLTTVMQC